MPLKGVKVGLDAEKIIEKVNELPKGGAKLKLVGSTVGSAGVFVWHSTAYVKLTAAVCSCMHV